MKNLLIKKAECKDLQTIYMEYKIERQHIKCQNLEMTE